MSQVEEKNDTKQDATVKENLTTQKLPESTLAEEKPSVPGHNRDVSEVKQVPSGVDATSDGVNKKNHADSQAIDPKQGSYKTSRFTRFDAPRKTVLDKYADGDRKRVSLWDKMDRVKPLPYLQSRRGKSIQMHEALKRQRNFDETSVPQSNRPTPTSVTSRGGYASGSRHQGLPDPRDVGLSTGRYNSERRGYENGHFREAHFDRWSPRDRPYDRRGEPRYHDSRRSVDRYDTHRVHDRRERGRDRRYSRSRSRSRSSGRRGHKPQPPVPREYDPKMSMNPLANPAILEIYRQQMLAMQTGFSPASAGMAPQIMPVPGMGDISDIAAVAAKAGESSRRTASSAKGVSDEDKKEKIVQFPRFELLPAEGGFVTNVYPYYCFLAEIVDVEAPVVKLKDVRGEERKLKFTDDTGFEAAIVPPTFRWEDLEPGHTIAILQAKTKMIDGQKGILIDRRRLKDVFVFYDNLANVCNAVVKLTSDAYQSKKICGLASCSNSAGEASLEPCGNCGQIFYCCEKHQRESWFNEGHAQLCAQAGVIGALLKTRFTGPTEFHFGTLLGV